MISSTIIYIIGLLFRVLEMMLLIRALLSWVSIDPYSSAGKAYQVLIDLTEPIIRPCRQFLNRYVNTGMFDFSIILAFFLLAIVQRVLVRLVLLIF